MTHTPIDDSQRVVPVEPTDEMVSLALSHLGIPGHWREDARPIGTFYPGFTADESEAANWKYHAKDRVVEAYKAMLAAAPAASPPVAPLAAAQEGVSVGVRAKPLQFKCAEYADGSKEWDDSDMGFHIGFDPDEEDGERYRAACGEGESETFATLEEAKEWCQSEADKWVRKVAYSHPPAQTQGGDQPEDRRDGERLDWLMRQVRGDEFRRIGIHTSAGCTRAAIDAAREG